ncbi:MAG TPA: type II secretion system protein, partial [Bryobacteraceae bacterium]|nr:type II secretion system protein [Bryobacteraceae bacterium]
MKRRKRESGFAMLLVFLMAACIAITLYMEIPRVAFEAERQRELLLVDRGNQFKRAIQVFVTDKTNNPTHRFPASLDELENFNNHRYLRHRYIDPMTGKDEWRLIHINGGVLTDSVTTQQKNTQNAQAGSGSGGSTYVSQQAYLNVPTGDSGDGTAGVNRALQNRRPSEGGGAPGDPNNPA